MNKLIQRNLNPSSSSKRFLTAASLSATRSFSSAKEPKYLKNWTEKGEDAF